MVSENKKIISNGLTFTVYQQLHLYYLLLTYLLSVIEQVVKESLKL